MEQTPIHDQANLELLAIMKPGMGCVVEIGSSSGAIARDYRAANPGCYYIGMEIDAAYADASRAHCQEVLVGNVENLPDAELRALCERADGWVFGDVLEHLYDPWKLLRRIREFSKPGTEIAACVPNAQYWGLQMLLNQGQFVYQNDGLLDRTHIRWFTRNTLLSMFFETGYQPLAMAMRAVREPNAEMAQALRGMALAGRADPEQAYNDSLAYQYVLRAVAV